MKESKTASLEDIVIKDEDNQILVIEEMVKKLHLAYKDGYAEGYKARDELSCVNCGDGSKDVEL